MYLLLIAAASFLISLCLTPVCREIFLRFGLVDRPDHVRKFHIRATPRVGGVAVALAYVIPLVTFSLLASRPPHIPMAGVPFRWEFPAGAAIVFGAGLLDDVRGLRPWQKLLAQFAGAALACAAGVRINGISALPLGSAVGVAVTLVWLVGCTNAFNLIDGIDGLAAGVGVFATLTMMLAAAFQHNAAVMFVTAPLAASLLAFLRYNFSPASIFLGDSGSMLVGFLLGCYGVLWSEKSATVLGMMAPVTALAFPLLDAALAIIRRFLRGQPIFSGDRRHIHHMLLDRGLTPRRVVFLLYGFCALAAVVSLLQSTREFAGVAILLFCVGFWIGIQRLGYVEFGVLGRMLTEATSLRTIHARIHLSEFRAAIASSRTPDECWEALLRYYKRFGFSEVSLSLGGNVYTSSRHKPSSTAGALTVIIRLSPLDSARLSRDEAEPESFAAAAFADTLAAALKEKLAESQTSAVALPGAEHLGAYSPPQLVP